VTRLKDYEIFLCKCIAQVFGVSVLCRCFAQVFGAFAQANISVIVTNTNRQRAFVTDGYWKDMSESMYKKFGPL